MIRINLLPHREERRKAQRAQFYMLAALTVGIGLGLAVFVHIGIAQVVADQNDRNAYLKKQISDLDSEIAEIKKLRDDIKALLARKQVIEALQSDRARPVRLLDELVRRAPDGIYLKSLKQTGHKVNVTGYAQSSARVSMFMRNLQEADIVDPQSEGGQLSPQLIEIKSATVNGRAVSEFNLNFRLKKPAVDASAIATAPADGKKPLRSAASAKKS
jgi:type IV pilus assembly protein PilN